MTCVSFVLCRMYFVDDFLPVICVVHPQQNPEESLPQCILMPAILDALTPRINASICLIHSFSCHFNGKDMNDTSCKCDHDVFLILHTGDATAASSETIKVLAPPPDASSLIRPFLLPDTLMRLAKPQVGVASINRNQFPFECLFLGNENSTAAYFHRHY